MIEATGQQAVEEEVDRRLDRRGLTLEVPASARKPATDPRWRGNDNASYSL